MSSFFKRLYSTLFIPFLLILFVPNLFTSKSYADLIEVKEDWLCNDFGDKYCLFEDDLNGCSLPGMGVKECINEDKSVDGNKCLIGENNGVEKLLTEIDGKVYLYELEANLVNDGLKEKDSKSYCVKLGAKKFSPPMNNHSNYNNNVCHDLSDYYYHDSSKAAAFCAKNLNDKDVIYGYVTDVTQVYKVVSSYDGKKTCGTKDYNCDKQYCDSSKLCKKCKNGWSSCSDNNCIEWGKSECESLSKNPEYEDFGNRYFIKKSCCIENKGYKQTCKKNNNCSSYANDNKHYYQTDKYDDKYVKFCAKYADCSWCNKYNPPPCVEYYYVRKADILEYKFDNYENTKSSYFVLLYDKYREETRYYTNIRTATIKVSKDRNSLLKENKLYKLVYKFPKEVSLNSISDKYALRAKTHTDLTIIGLVLKDVNCIDKQNDKCFLSQKKTCLISQRSVYHTCKLENASSACDVCVKWGINLSEFSYEGFMNAKFECMEHKIIKRDDSGFQSLRDSIPNQIVINGSASLSGNTCTYTFPDTWIKKEKEYKIKDARITYYINVKYDSSNSSGSPSTRNIESYCDDDGGYKCWEEGWFGTGYTLCNGSNWGYGYKQFLGLNCGGNVYRLGNNLSYNKNKWYCSLTPAYCVYYEVNCGNSSPNRGKLSESNDIKSLTYWEKTYQRRNVEFEEIYDPNWVYE